MKKSQSTRQSIIETALIQSSRVGLEGISLGGIASAVGMSKSGLFAHFKSKEAVQLAVLEEAISSFRDRVIGPAQEKPEGLDRLRAYFDLYLDWIAGENAKFTCPFTTFVQEYDDRPGTIQTLLVKSQKRWRRLLAEEVSRAMDKGVISRAINPNQISFELIGAALSFQVSFNLLASEDARGQATRAFAHLVNRKE